MFNVNKSLIEKILDEKSLLKEIKESIDKIYLSFNKATNINGILEKAEHASILPDGEALSPQTAASCIFDYVKTTKFLRGIKKAIDSVLAKNPDEKVKIMYVGSGPFASLIIPLIPFYNSKQLEINIIDFHQVSIDALNSIISEYSLKNYFNDILAIDAMEFNMQRKFDIIIIETMQKALIAEPQVALTNHFSKFLSDDGIIIPQEIKVTAALADLHSETTFSQNKWTNFWLSIKRKNAIDNRIILNDIFLLDKHVTKNYFNKNLIDNTISLQTIKVAKKNSKMKDLILLTEIKVFDDLILSEEDETGLTKLYFDQNVKPIKNGTKIIFSYNLGKYPKFSANIEDLDISSKSLAH